MTRKIFSFLVIAGILTTVGCSRSRQQKIDDFVNAFNQAAPQMRSSVFRSAQAKSGSSDTIRIEMVLNAGPQDVEKDAYSKLGPTIIANLLREVADADSVLEEGAKFNIVFMANDGSQIVNKTMNKNQFDAATDDKSRLFNQTSGKPAPGTESDLSEQTKRMLKILNQNLPIVNKEAGTSVTRIDVDKNNELIYTIVLTPESARSLRNPQSQKMATDAIAQDPNLERMFPSFEDIGIYRVHYLYVDEKGDTIFDVALTKNDIR